MKNSRVHYMIVHPQQDYNFWVKSCDLKPIHKSEPDQGATFDPFYYVPQGECCMGCTVNWQREVERRGREPEGVL